MWCVLCILILAFQEYLYSCFPFLCQILKDITTDIENTFSTKTEQEYLQLASEVFKQATKLHATETYCATAFMTSQDEIPGE